MNDSTGQSLPEGWYPDPHDDRLMRYWNGGAWTERVSERPGAKAVSDAAISDPTQTRYAEILQPDLDEEPTPGSSRRVLTITIVLSIVLVGILVALATWALIDDTDSAGSGDGTQTKIAAGDVVKTFARDGLPVTAVEVYTAGNDPDGLLGRSRLYTSKAAFRDASVQDRDTANRFAVTNGGSVEVFASATDAEKRESLLAGSQSGEHVATAGAVLLRLSPAMAPTEVAAYERSLHDSYG